MLSSVKNTIVISDEKTGGITATIIAEYRWWTGEADPWKNFSVGILPCSGGTWRYISSGNANFYTDETEPSLALRFFDLPENILGNPFRLEQTGSGLNKLNGGKMPLGVITWRVINVI
jgi:hypothetical protein